ncbi:MAG: hypothetical protein QXF41_03170 [Candidatus Micrarchaeaceae archaeon]
MLFKRKEQPQDLSKIDKDLLLRANIAQGIKHLYFDRNRLFFPENRDYNKLNETFEHIRKNLSELKERQPRMLIFGDKGVEYEQLDDKMIDNIMEYLKFLLYLPPPNRMFIRWKKSFEIGKMKVPTLTYILFSLLDYKLPNFWLDKLDEYSNETAAIIDILGEVSDNPKITSIISKIKEKIKDINEGEKEDYKKKISEWMRLGLMI